MKNNLIGKKLLILGGNAETVPLVQLANELGIKTIVSSARESDPAKKYAWKVDNYQGMDVEEWVALIKREQIDGVLVGVADILVPAYSKVCEAVGFPCYATEKIINAFSSKDNFKKTCKQFGIKGIPEYQFNSDGKSIEEDVHYPVMVKPVDNGGGVGMTLVHKQEDITSAIHKALNYSKVKRFIVEQYMDCDDLCMYFTFKDGECSLSCIFDRYTTHIQDGFSRVNTLSVYPSEHIDLYYEKYHQKFKSMFDFLDIKDGVLAISAFVDNNDFYVYDPGFRLQGEAPHLLLKEIHGYDQREMLINLALTGSQGDFSILEADALGFNGKYAATLWFLLREGVIGKISGLEEVRKFPFVYYNVQRLFENDEVPSDSIGTERQVLTRLYIICNSKKNLAKAINNCINTVRVTDIAGKNMLIPFVEANDFIQGVLNEA